MATLVVIALALVVGTITFAASGSGAWGYVGLALTAGGVAVSYLRPWAGLAAVGLGPLVCALGGSEPIAVWSMACFAALVLTLRSLPGLPVGITVGLGNLAAAGFAGGTLDVSANPGASIAAFAAFVAAASGSAVRSQRRYWFELEQRTNEAIATRESMVERGIAEERVRIARDLHDSVGHHIAVVSMHLGAAQVQLPRGADAAQSALIAAREGIQAVLLETQQILAVLRIRDDLNAVQPTPDHHRVSSLVESFSSAGMHIEPRMEGLERSLSPSVSTATFRIVEEALTNAQRHGTGTVSLTVAIDDLQVAIEVVNVIRDRRGANVVPSGGNGLVGMRERAHSAGGTLETRSADNLFWITATLPIGEETNR